MKKRIMSLKKNIEFSYCPQHVNQKGFIKYKYPWLQLYESGVAGAHRFPGQRPRSCRKSEVSNSKDPLCTAGAYPIFW